MWPLALVLAVAPVKLAVPAFSCAGIEPAVCGAYVERVASLISREGVRVSTAADIQQLLGMERERQLLGCTEGSCSAELGAALGVDGIVRGAVVKTEAGFLATLKVVRASNGSTWLTATERARGQEQLESFLDLTARDFGDQLVPRAPTHVERWVPAMVGGAALATGAVFYGLSKVDAATLRDSSRPVSDVPGLVARGQTREALGLSLIGVGLGGIAASALWQALAPTATVQVGLVPGRDGAGLWVGGPLP